MAAAWLMKLPRFSDAEPSGRSRHLGSELDLIVGRLEPGYAAPDLHTEALCQEPMCLICTPQHPLATLKRVGWPLLHTTAQRHSQTHLRWRQRKTIHRRDSFVHRCQYGPSRGDWTREVPCAAVNCGLSTRLPSMSAASPGNASALFDFKSATLSLEAFLLRTANLTSLSQALTERFGSTPDLFNGEPVVIDLSHLASLELNVNFPELIALLARFKLKAIAVRGGTVAQTQSAQNAGLIEAPESHAHAARVETVVQEVVREVIREVPVEVPVHVPMAASTMFIDKPLRSGQQVYAKGGDLIVLAAVNHGAEVIADGSIHVYAPLRGKAIAGAKGNTEARIFSICMEPELLSIAGTYRTTDTPLPPDVTGKPAQIRLEGDRLVFDPISL